MNRLTITQTPHIECTFTVDDWELYSTEDCCLEKRGIFSTSEEACKDLNFQLETFVNSGYTKAQARKYMHHIMTDLASYGAADTEPMGFLEDVLDRIYGKDQ